MKSAAGLGNGLFSANQRGSVWPCGEIIGRSRTVSYNLAATARAVGSAGKSRFASSMGSLTPLGATRRPAFASFFFGDRRNRPTPLYPGLAPTEKSTHRRNIRSTLAQNRVRKTQSVGNIDGGRRLAGTGASPRGVEHPVPHIAICRHRSEERRGGKECRSR